mmetsp:Transcript_18055/g.35504  ORF Transcript_18055/g.35504 Transcript_18055/m.35504 type:complete len:809 (-) Transcript_18055:321-2747(-)|eukprot:CAMPEP_0171507672 /NCGR_PEP_ID=MMETSP0958-20121227/13669_1 /TAXON_ID=87120 /ORGANISM="Aurantiochytrium limacinum, Strain ATCCMYA-1381" /LENGTH=808 /DNA_ID=CAMNT_0012044475 /DNA_START=180 /DNA_END=2606 /DNA_ORIENTATION=-
MITSKEERAMDSERVEDVSATASTSAASFDKPRLYTPGAWPMREVHIPIPMTKGIFCNPVTSFFGIVVLWALVIWCVVSPSGSYDSLTTAQAGITEYFTWFYIITTPIMFFFMAFLYIVYGNEKLGEPTDKPEFSSASYFAMLFSAGVAIGLFFYGVSEPLYHLTTNRFDTGYHSVAEYNIHAINLTLYHWGFGAWTCYVSIGIVAGFAAYREKLPLTMRSCFYPVIGQYIWGFWGDIVDAFCIIVVVSGVCTSLGLGAIQLVDGINSLTDLGLEDGSIGMRNAQIICIWVVTAMATISVVSGLDVGIKILSNIALLLGLVLWFLVLFLDDTKFLLNTIVESIGWYFQWNILQVHFATDAFGQLTRGNGRGIDGDSYEGLGAVSSWMNSWTIYYWAWWTAWASFVGLFIARISKGRTIREVINFTLAGPLIYAFAWFSVFGGAGIRAYRRAEEAIQLGTFLGDPDMFLAPGSTECYNPPTEPMSVTFIDKTGANATWDFVNEFPGIAPVCMTISNSSWWNLLLSYYNYGHFLSWVAIFALAIYFVTSADSGSLVIDHMASNGNDEEGYYIQRIFWSVTLGAVATALLVAGQGESDALSALQSVMIIAGLPFTVIQCTACISLWRFLMQNVYPEWYFSHKEFKMHFAAGVFNYFDLACSLGGYFKHPERTFITVPDARTHYETLRALFLPGWSTFIVLSHMNGPRNSDKFINISVGILVQVFFFGWIAFFAGMVAEPGFDAFGWLCYFFNGFILGAIRNVVRQRYRILGNYAEDTAAGLVAYYQLLAQLVIQVEDVDDDESSVGSSNKI